jgi:hypothetical protein
MSQLYFDFVLKQDQDKAGKLVLTDNYKKGGKT